MGLDYFFAMLSINWQLNMGMMWGFSKKRKTNKTCKCFLWQLLFYLWLLPSQTIELIRIHKMLPRLLIAFLLAMHDSMHSPNFFCTELPHWLPNKPYTFITGGEGSMVQKWGERSITITLDQRGLRDLNLNLPFSNWHFGLGSFDP